MAYVRLRRKTCKPRTKKEICECPLDTEIIDSHFKDEFMDEKIRLIPSCISQFNKLKRVYFYKHDIYNLENLNGIKTLEDIAIDYDEKLRRVNDFDDLPSLKRLHFHGCQIEEIGKLDLPSLESLNITESEKSFKIENLDKVPSLKTLKIRKSHLSKIEGLEKLGKLENLELSSNEIKKIEGLDNLKNLKTLQLQRNLIGKIEGLDNLKNLEKLNLGSNEIKKFENFGELKNLRYLDVKDNEIKKISRDELEKLVALEELVVYSTVPFEVELGKNKNLKKLNVLVFHTWRGKRLRNPFLKIKGIYNSPSLENIEISRRSGGWVLLPPIITENEETRRIVLSYKLKNEWLDENRYEELV